MSDNTPTLEELFEKFRQFLKDPESYRQSFEIYFRSVASGQAEPVLSNSNAVMAAQCVVVILEHIKREAKGGEA